MRMFYSPMNILALTALFLNLFFDPFYEKLIKHPTEDLPLISLQLFLHGGDLVPAQVFPQQCNPIPDM